jgi:hypothetical protein
VKAESYPGNTGGEITLELRTSPDLLRWTRRVGDTIDYLRAALNYAAYQIALTDCPGKASSVEFPIFNDPATFQAKNRVKDFATVRLALSSPCSHSPGGLRSYGGFTSWPVSIVTVSSSRSSTSPVSSWTPTR